MRILSILLLFILSFPLAGRAVAQDCTNPDGDVGVLRYNLDYGVLQGCTPKNWVALHSVICPDGDACIDPCDDSPALGTMCDDGSYYIGLSPENGAKTFMTSAAHEGSGIRFDNASCEYCGDGSVATSLTDGRANTNALLAFNATGFDAANHCEGLNAIEAHGHDDWYLPAGGSGTGTEQNLFWAMVQAEGTVDGIGSNSDWYWSSSENTSTYAWFQRFSNGNQSTIYKYFPTLARCVRRSSDPIWTTPEGTVATIDLGAALNATVTATDDSGTVTYSKDSGAEWISVNSTTGALTGTAPNSATTASITITATDPSGNTASRTFDVVVEEPDPCEAGPVGTRCTSDGAIYAGTTVGGVPMYAAACDHGMTWDGSSCTGSQIWRIWKTSNTITPGAFSSTDGVANTNAMEAAGLSDHPAAEACRTMGPEWYLPARGELGTIWSNLVNGAPDADGNEVTDDFAFNIMSGSDGWYYSSSDGGANAGRAWFVVFSSGWNGDQSPNGVKSSSIPVRCVRR